MLKLKKNDIIRYRKAREFSEWESFVAQISLEDSTQVKTLYKETKSVWNKKKV